MTAIDTARMVGTVLVELDYMAEEGGEPVLKTLYLSDRVYFDGSGTHPYVDCVKTIPRFNRSIEGVWFNEYSAQIGSLELDNADGNVDYLLGLAIDGCGVRFYYGSVVDARDDFVLMYSALSLRADATAFDTIVVQLKDTGLLLNKSFPSAGSIGGTGPNADKPQPINVGYVHNMEPLCVDAGTLLYRHSDASGPAEVFALAVRDRGIDADYTDNLDGTFTLTTTPDGLVTCDVLTTAEGTDPGDFDHVRRLHAVMDELIGARCGLDDLGLYAGPGPTFWVEGALDFMLGLSMAEPRNVIDALRELTDSGLVFWAIKRTGEFTFGCLRTFSIQDLIDHNPELGGVTIREDDIDEGSFRIEHHEPMYYQFRATRSRNWVVQTDLASSLTPDEQAVYRRKGEFLLQEIPAGTSYADAPQLYHLSLTISPLLDTLLSSGWGEDLDEFQAWMDHRRNMFLPWLEVIYVTVGLEFYALELGDPVTLITPRFGQQSGILLQVTGINIRLTDKKVDLRLMRSGRFNTYNEGGTWPPPPPPEEPPDIPDIPFIPISCPLRSLGYGADHSAPGDNGYKTGYNPYNYWEYPEIVSMEDQAEPFTVGPVAQSRADLNLYEFAAYNTGAWQAWCGPMYLVGGELKRIWINAFRPFQCDDITNQTTDDANYPRFTLGSGVMPACLYDNDPPNRDYRLDWGQFSGSAGIRQFFVSTGWTLGVQEIPGVDGPIIGEDLAELAGKWLQGCTTTGDRTRMFLFTGPAQYDTLGDVDEWFELTNGVITRQGTIDPPIISTDIAFSDTAGNGVSGFMACSADNSGRYIWTVNQYTVRCFYIDDDNNMALICDPIAAQQSEYASSFPFTAISAFAPSKAVILYYKYWEAFSGT